MHMKVAPLHKSTLRMSDFRDTDLNVLFTFVTCEQMSLCPYVLIAQHLAPQKSCQHYPVPT